MCSEKQRNDHCSVLEKALKLFGSKITDSLKLQHFFQTIFQPTSSIRGISLHVSLFTTNLNLRDPFSKELCC